MIEIKRTNESKQSHEFTQEAEGTSHGIVREFVDFLLNRRKWWLVPVIFALLLVTVLVMLSSTAVAPFIYTLF